MAATAEEFGEVLSQEVYVDVEKLRSMAMHGCPAEVRSDVWRYLLRVAVPDICMCLLILSLYVTAWVLEWMFVREGKRRGVEEM